MQSSLTVSTVFACVGLLSESIAQLPMKVISNNKELANHPLQKLINRPNSFQTGFELREWMMTSLCLTGNAYLYIVRDGRGNPRELLPLRAGSVSVSQGSDWGLTFFVSCNNVNRVVPSQDILHIKYRTLDGVHGISPIGYARDSIALALSTQKYGNNYFKNSATPKGILSYSGELTEEAAANLKESWQKAFAGDSSFTTAVLEDSLKYQPLSVSNEDAQFLQTREFTVAEIARIFRVPLHEIQCTTGTTSWGSGIEQMSIGFVSRTLMPWIRRIEEVFNTCLVPDGENIEIRLNVEGFLRGDTASRYAAYATAIQNGIMSPNECRAKERLEPYPGGEKYQMALNMGTNSEEVNDTGKNAHS